MWYLFVIYIKIQGQWTYKYAISNDKNYNPGGVYSLVYDFPSREDAIHFLTVLGEV
jgi:hypothetical protein